MKILRKVEHQYQTKKAKVQWGVHSSKEMTITAKLTEKKTITLLQDKLLRAIKKTLSLEIREQSKEL